MRIALFTDGTYPYVIGGMQKHSYYLAKYFAQTGVVVDLYHTNKSEYDIHQLEFFTEAEKKNIRSFVIPFTQTDKLPGHYIRSSYAYSIKLFELFKQNGAVDYVYAKGFTAWKLIEEKKKGFTSAPVGINFHGYEMFQKAPSFRSRLESVLLLRKPVLYNVHNADHVFSYGGKITTIILSLGINKNKIIEVPTGIEDNWLNPDSLLVNNPIRFLYVGRFERRKGVEELNMVLQKMTGKSPFVFNFIGPIPEHKKLTIPEVNYLGSISDQKEIQRIMKQSDVLVCPSHSEGMPNVIIEGMASGLAVIATDVGAVSKMVNEENGWLIPPSAINALETAITQCLTIAPAILKAKRQSSVQRVSQHFLWKNLIHDIRKAISEKVIID